MKEANEKFVSSAFDLEREREWRQRENQLKVQIAQLEATLKADLGEKGGILDKYAIERGTFCPPKYLNTYIVAIFTRIEAVIAIHLIVYV